MTSIGPKLLDFNAVLKDFRYKPNVRYGAYERDGKWWVRIVMFVENARGPWAPWELTPYPDNRGEYEYINDFMRIPKGPSGVGWSPSREMMELTGQYAIPPMFHAGDDLLFVEWMVHQIKGFEDHETDEWLRYKGELINDPHKEVAV